MKINYIDYGNYGRKRFEGCEFRTAPYRPGRRDVILIGEPIEPWKKSSETQQELQFLQRDGVVVVTFDLTNDPLGSRTVRQEQRVSTRRATFEEMGNFALMVAEETGEIFKELKTGKSRLIGKDPISQSDAKAIRRFATTSLDMMEKSILLDTTSGIDLARIRISKRRIETL